MVISSGECLNVDLLGHRACIVFRLWIETVKAPSKKFGSLQTHLSRVQEFMFASPPTLGSITLNTFTF